MRDYRRVVVAAVGLLAMLVAVHPAAGQIRSGGAGSSAPVRGTGRVAGPPTPSPTPMPTPVPMPTTSPTAPPNFHYRPPTLPPLFLGHRGVHWPFLGWGSIGFAYVPEWYGGVGFTAPIAPLPDDAPRGGLQLDIEPRRAQVYVDGRLVGQVEAFSGYYKHLSITAGPHLLQVIAPDYDPLSFEVMIAPSRTTTYRWSMTRAPGR